jgi:3-oxoisoapionate decarboxylase
MISRRRILGWASAVPAWSALISPDRAGSASLTETSSAAQLPGIPRMGGTPTAFALRSRAARESGNAFDMVGHCHGLGLGGVQLNPPSTDPEKVKRFRRRLEDYGMHLICNPRLPRQQEELEPFEVQVKAFKEAGATALHAAMTGRRYEDFDSLDPFKQMFEQCQKSVALAEPILRKHRMRLGIENHKGWRSAEQVAWLKHLGSEWVGVCLDFGNNVALCEEPMDTVRTLAPYAFFAHIKDVAVEEYPDGFLLSEVPLGDGLLNLGQIVETLRKTDPRMVFNLEMITRDPLQIPLLTPKYWATFDDAYSPLPGRDVAKVMAMVRSNRPRTPLPKIAGLNVAEQVRTEDSSNQKCIDYARHHLNL